MNFKPNEELMDEALAELEAEERAAQAQAGDKAPPPKPPPKPLVLRLDEFLKQYVAPDYIVDGILQRGYLYSVTGLTGAGKSAWALLVAFIMANGGGKIGEREIVAGRIVYICKENPIDIMMRLMAMCERAGVQWADIADRFLVIPEISSIQRR